MEVWKAVPGYEGLYEISDHGRARSLARLVQRGNSMLPVKEKLLKPSISDGYPTYSFSKDGKPKPMKAHIAVMLAFVGPRPAGMDVCHKDGVRSNSHLSNLRYGSRRENMGDAILHGTLAGENNGNSKLTGQDVSDILRRYAEFEEKIAAEYKVTSGTIRNIKMGRTYMGIGRKKAA